VKWVDDIPSFPMSTIPGVMDAISHRPRHYETRNPSILAEDSCRPLPPTSSLAGMPAGASAIGLRQYRYAIPQDIHMGREMPTNRPG
jgi:hypothetical protein